MANIRFDSEAMLHQMAAQPITSESASRFVSVLDANHRPLILCVGNDKHFYALQANSSGAFVPIDLSAKLGISGDVQAIGVSQNPDSKLLYIAFATGDNSTQSILHILSPIAPTFVNVSDDDLRHALLFNNSPPQHVRITDFHINPAIKGKWPLLVAIWRPASGGSSDDAKIARVSVLPNRWEWSEDLSLPQTVKDIHDVCPLHTLAGEGEGIACLYQYKETKSIIFTTTGEKDKWTTQLELPKGADPHSLASTLDKDGLSTLLVSGTGLYRFTSDEIVQSGSIATQISSDPMYKTASRLTVAQTGQDFALWFRTDDHILGYQHGHAENIIDSPIPLLPRGSNADFAPLLDPQSKSQSLIVLGESNNLTLMTQSADTKMWKAIPLMVYHLDKVMDVQAFVSHIEVKDVDGMPIASEDYALSCSGWTRALINGFEHALDKNTTVVRTNERGIITIVVPTEDISSYVYTLDNATTTKNKHHLVKSHTVDPSLKIQERLGPALAGKNLRDIDTPEGKLLEGSTATDGEVHAAQEALKGLSVVLKNPQLNSLVSSTTTDFPAVSFANMSFRPWEWWEWVKEKFHDVTEYVIDKLNDAWHFIVSLAGETWAFILDTATAVIKAISWVLKKIGAAFKKLWAWVSYIFNIKDIKDVASSLRTMFNSALTYGQVFILSKRDEVDTWADRLESKLLDALKIKLPAQIAEKEQRPKDLTADDISKNLDSVSAPCNVGLYQLEQGKDAVGNSLTTAFKSSNPVSMFYKDVILPILKELQGDIKVVGELIFKLFSGGNSASVKDLVAEVAATLIHTLARCLKKLITGFMTLGADLIKALTDFINTPLSDFPVIGPILKLMGLNATILDIIVYVIAVPVTVFAKLITGKPPRRILEFDYKALVEGGITDSDENVLKAYMELGSYVGITEAFFESLYDIYKIATAEVPENEEFSAIGLTFSLIGSAITFPFARTEPAWDMRLAIWSANLANKLVHAVCTKAQAPPKLTSVIDAAVAIVAFTLAQVVHHDQIEETWKWKDDALIGFSVGSSVYELVEVVSGTVGVVAVDPLTKLGATVVVGGCGASRAVIRMGTSVRENKLGKW